MLYTWTHDGNTPRTWTAIDGPPNRKLCIGPSQHRHTNVRVHRGDGFSVALLATTQAKQRRMLHAAAAYLSGFGYQPPAARIDVVLVSFDRAGRLLGIEHIENAVEAE